MDDEAAFGAALELAEACVEGTLTALQTGRDIVAYINPWAPAWHALGGAEGPLSSFYLAMDEALRLHFLGDDIEQWPPDIRPGKRLEVAQAEAKLGPRVLEACRALIGYAAGQIVG